jgi:hypothetical protein
VTYVVSRAIGREGALVREPARRVVRPKVLEDVVLDERVRAPAVDGQVAVPVRGVLARVRDHPGRCASAVTNQRGRRATYCADPGFQPLPPTKLPFPDHWMLYSPALPLLYETCAPDAPSVQNE